MNEVTITTVRPFSRKHGIPENLLRSMVKRGTLPGFYEGTRFYVHEEQALEALNRMSRREMASTQ